MSINLNIHRVTKIVKTKWKRVNKEAENMDITIFTENNQPFTIQLFRYKKKDKEN